MKPDKGVGIFYFRFLLTISEKCLIFLMAKQNLKLSCNEISAKREVTLNNLVRKILRNGNLTDKLCKDLYSVSGRPSIMHGLPKIHMQNILLRPIISSIGIFSYK